MFGIDYYKHTMQFCTLEITKDIDWTKCVLKPVSALQLGLAMTFSLVFSWNIIVCCLTSHVLLLYSYSIVRLDSQATELIRNYRCFCAINRYWVISLTNYWSQWGPGRLWSKSVCIALWCVKVYRGVLAVGLWVMHDVTEILTKQVYCDKNYR